jgi:hypothetical protein
VYVAVSLCAAAFDAEREDLGASEFVAQCPAVADLLAGVGLGSTQDSALGVQRGSLDKPFFKLPHLQQSGSSLWYNFFQALAFPPMVRRAVRENDRRGAGLT